MKKGEASKEFITSMILILAILVVVLYMVNGWQKAADAAARAESCKTSVLANAALHQRGLELGNNMDSVICPTEEIVISKKANDREIKQKIAKAMVTCWNNFGKGELNLFSKDNLYCSICATISFEDETRELSDFSDFLAKNGPDNSNLMYVDILTGSKKGNTVETLENHVNSKGLLDQNQVKKNEIMSTNRDYAVIFMYAKGKEYLDLLSTRALVDNPGTAIHVIGSGSTVVTGAAGVVVGVLFLTGPVGWVAIGIGSAAIVVGSVWFSATDGPSEDVSAAVTVLREIDFDDIGSLGCTYLPSEQ